MGSLELELRLGRVPLRLDVERVEPPLHGALRLASNPLVAVGSHYGFTGLIDHPEQISDGFEVLRFFGGHYGAGILLRKAVEFLEILTECIGRFQVERRGGQHVLRNL